MSEMTTTTTDTPLLELRDVRKTFGARGRLGLGRGREVHAVDGVDLTLRRGSTTALVGESGSGKSTLARLILHLHQADAGEVLLDGVSVGGLSEAAFRAHRATVQMVFQNPLTSFDPAHTIGSSIKETMRLAPPPGDVDTAVGELLTQVGLTPRFAGLRPRDVSGGELQRAGIARALSVRPALVVMDEPTSALDMSIQGQILELLRNLQREHQLTYLIVTHDLRTVRMIADDVAVMYLGQIVEQGPTAEVFGEPRHPYTRGLLYAHDLDARGDEESAIAIRGTLTQDGAETGCRLRPRCPLAVDRCAQPQPLAAVEGGGDGAGARRARCWRGVEGPLPVEVAGAGAGGDRA
jgi:oligopeptide transport system ATP-binding protein